VDSHVQSNYCASVHTSSDAMPLPDPGSKRWITRRTATRRQPLSRSPRYRSRTVEYATRSPSLKPGVKFPPRQVAVIAGNGHSKFLAGFAAPKSGLGRPNRQLDSSAGKGGSSVERGRAERGSKRPDDGPGPGASRCSRPVTNHLSHPDFTVVRPVDLKHSFGSNA
jgi:hypothetical protein